MTVPVEIGIQRNIIAITEALDPRSEAVFDDLLVDESASREFASFVRQELVSPTVYMTLGRNEPLPARAASFQVALESDFQRQSALHRRLLSFLDELDAHLASRGVEFVLMKGPIYAQELYGDLDGRHYADLDILVRPADAAKALESVTEMGLAPRVNPIFPQRITRLFEHGFALTSDELNVDLHHALRVRPAYRVDQERLWNSVRSATIGTTTVLALSEEYEIVSAVLGIAHDLERNACRAKILIDLYLLLLRAAPRIDWEEFLERRQGENLLAITVEVLAGLLLLLNSPKQLAGLEESLSRHADKRITNDLSDVVPLIDRSTPGRLNRRWFLQVYPAPGIYYRLWLAAAFVASSEFPDNVRKRLGRRI